MGDGSSWPGDWVPTDSGYGGIDGDCPECGEKLMWTGWGWSVHSIGYHQGVRRRLCGAIRSILARETRARLRGAQAATQGAVALRWKCGALRGPGNEWWTDVPGELLEEAQRNPEFWNDCLKGIRATLSDYVESVHGVTVNPATWLHKVYDER